MDSKFTKVMMAQFKKATKEYNENIKFYFDESKPNEWYLLVHNLSGDNDEYTGGEFLFRLVAPADGDKPFPYSPPSFYAVTPNGLYEPGGKICISIGEYHASNYRAALGMDGFAANIISGLIGWKDMGGGIHIIRTEIDDKKKLSKNSADWNKKNYGELMKSMKVAYEGYAEKWTKRPDYRIKSFGETIVDPPAKLTSSPLSSSAAPVDDLVNQVGKLLLGDAPLDNQ